MKRNTSDLLSELEWSVEVGVRISAILMQTLASNLFILQKWKDVDAHNYIYHLYALHYSVRLHFKGLISIIK